MDLEKTKSVSYEGFRVTIRPANYRIGLTRTLLMDQARRAEPGEQDLTDPAQLAAAVGRVMLWPSLIAPVTDHHGFEHWPISADELLDLPEAFVAEWEQAVYSLNPHWRAEPAETQEKKAPIG